jgi:hypothetical protein
MSFAAFDPISSTTYQFSPNLAGGSTSWLIEGKPDFPSEFRTGATFGTGKNAWLITDSSGRTHRLGRQWATFTRTLVASILVVADMKF